MIVVLDERGCLEGLFGEKKCYGGILVRRVEGNCKKNNKEFGKLN